MMMNPFKAPRTLIKASLLCDDQWHTVQGPSVVNNYTNSNYIVSTKHSLTDALHSS